MGASVTCPACGAQGDFRATDRCDGFRIVRCGACDLDFSDPMRSADADWYRHAYAIRHSAIDNRIRSYFRWACDAIPVRGRLLDVGCGEGVFVHYARRRGFEAHGVDFSEDAIALGRDWFGLTTLYNRSLEEVKSDPALTPFAALTLFEVLEHLEHPARLLADAHDLLAEGGVVAASVPFRDRWPVREFNDYPPHHLTRWTPRSVRVLFERNGFEVIEVRLGSAFRSYWTFLCYQVRKVIYAGLGRGYKGDQPPSGVQDPGAHWLASPRTRRLLSALRPRQIRDALTWPVAMLTYPLVFPWFRGYNVVVLARKR
jgi:SAM-dependent methyltransferase